MRAFKQQNEQMRKELQNRGAIQSDDKNQKNPIFKEMYRSLMRAKQILMGLMELLGLNDDSAEGGLIG